MRAIHSPLLVFWQRNVGTVPRLMAKHAPHSDNDYVRRRDERCVGTINTPVTAPDREWGVGVAEV